MKYVTATILSILAAVQSTSALAFTNNSPSITFCHVSSVSWTGGVAPYDLSVTGGQSPLDYSGLTTTSYRDDGFGQAGMLFAIILRKGLIKVTGEVITFHVTDATGATASTSKYIKL